MIELHKGVMSGLSLQVSDDADLLDTAIVLKFSFQSFLVNGGVKFVNEERLIRVGSGFGIGVGVPYIKS